MSDLTAKFTALEEQVATEHAEAQTTREAINTRLDEFSITLDTLLENNAYNTRLLLSAIGQNSPCAVCPTPPIVIPPFGATTLPVDTEACQRAQAFLNFMEGAFTVLDIASAVGIGFNPSLITDAFNQVIASLGGGDSPNPPSFPESVQLVGDLINYIALNLLRGSTLVGSFAPLYFDLRDALYLAGSPSAAKGQYTSVINSSSLDSDIKTVLIDAAYNDALSYFFDPTSDPDLTGIDGEACAGDIFDIVGCTDFLTTAVSRGGHNYWSLPFPPSYGPDPQFIAGDFFGWTIEVVGGDAGAVMGTYRDPVGGAGVLIGTDQPGDDPRPVVAHTTAIGFFSVAFAEDVGPFTLRLCPPE